MIYLRTRNTEVSSTSVLINGQVVKVHNGVANIRTEDMSLELVEDTLAKNKALHEFYIDYDLMNKHFPGLYKENKKPQKERVETVESFKDDPKIPQEEKRPKAKSI